VTYVKTERCGDFGCFAEPSAVSAKTGALSQYAAGGGLREGQRAAQTRPQQFYDRRREEMRVGFIALGVMGKGMAAESRVSRASPNGSRPILQDKVDALRASR
jgi:hypothetical protein